MADDKVRVLAVDDPAVQAYVRPELRAVEQWGGGAEFVVAPWEKYLGLMQDALDGKAEYDIVMVAGHLWKRDLVDRGLLLTLGRLDDDILDAVAHECSHAGEVYLSPSFCDGHMVVYDRERVGGLFAPLDPTAITPGEYLEIADKIGTGSVAVKAHPSEIFTDALPFLRMFGGDVYDSGGNPVCDSPDAVRGLEEYLRLRRYAFGDPSRCGNEQVAEALASGGAAVGITWSGQLGAVAGKARARADSFGFRTLTTAWNATWSFAVCAATPRPEAAKDLLAHLRSPAIDRLAGAISGAPVRRSTYLEGTAKYPWYACQLEMIEKHARPLPDIRHGGARNACLYEEIFRCFTGECDASEAMRRAAERIRDMD